MRDMKTALVNHRAAIVGSITWQFIIYVFYVEGVFDGVYALLGISPTSTGAMTFWGMMCAILLLELPLVAGISCLYWWPRALAPAGGRLRFPLLAVCGLLPVPALVLLRSGDGSGVALWLFFIGCTTLVTQAFVQDVRRPVGARAETVECIWRQRLARPGAALLTAFGIFSVAQLGFKGTSDLVEIALASLILIPSLCVVPYLTMATGKAFSAVVLTLFAVACMKFLGCIVVVLVYGWDASAHGYTSMPWTRPNLLVWLFWFNMTVLCSLFYHFGRKRFVQICEHAA